MKHSIGNLFLKGGRSIGKLFLKGSSVGMLVFYRADTTLLTADTTVFRADYKI